MFAITVEIHFRRAPSVITTREATGVDAAVDQAMRDARAMGWKEPVSKVRVHGPDRYIYPQQTAARLWRLFGEANKWREV